MKVLYDCAASIAVQELLEGMRDPTRPEAQRAELTWRFFKEVLVGWNFTRRRLVNGKTVVELLPQPPRGIKYLPLSVALTDALVEGFQRQFDSTPNRRA